MTALAEAFRRAAALQRIDLEHLPRVRSIVPPREPVKPGVERRHAEHASENCRPITVLAPHKETPMERHEECLRSFTMPAQRLAR